MKRSLDLLRVKNFGASPDSTILVKDYYEQNIEPEMRRS